MCNINKDCDPLCLSLSWRFFVSFLVHFFHCALKWIRDHTLNRGSYLRGHLNFFFLLPPTRFWTEIEGQQMKNDKYGQVRQRKIWGCNPACGQKGSVASFFHSSSLLCYQQQHHEGFILHCNTITCTFWYPLMLFVCCWMCLFVVLLLWLLKLYLQPHLVTPSPMWAVLMFPMMVSLTRMWIPFQFCYTRTHTLL